MRGDAEFQPSAELADSFCRTIVMNSVEQWSFRGEAVQQDLISFTATENDTAARPNVRGKTKALNRIPKRKGSHYFSHRALVARSFLNACAWATTALEVEASATSSIQDKAFDTDAEITMKKVLGVDAAAPGVVATEVSVKGSLNGGAFGRALDDVD